MGVKDVLLTLYCKSKTITLFLLFLNSLWSVTAKHFRRSAEKGRRTNANDGAKQYTLLDAQTIQETLLRWQREYPHFVQLKTSQEAYDLPRAGGPSDCPYDHENGVVEGCNNYFLTIQDFILHPEDSKSAKHLPEVLWSGCVHGNERVGPTAVMEAVDLLLLAASCEAKPSEIQYDNIAMNRLEHSSDNHIWKEKVEDAKKCRKNLYEMGIDDLHRKWLARLVSTRRIVVVPTANALGYYQDKREENHIDPNRDFPFDVQDATKCMQTIAGRTLNEIWRDHMFQLSLTYHGGMEVIGYEWGAPTWLGSLSPDHIAQNSIAKAYSDYGGGFKTSKPYQYGTMNDLVYYVRGGMEDWAYAGSWDPDRVIKCDPKTYGGYDTQKSVYNNATLRTFNMLVECSNHKTPQVNELGTSQDVMNKDTVANGHISRNIRLALLNADMVEPYVSVVGVNGLEISDDVVPLNVQQASGTDCQKTKTVMVPKNSTVVSVQWTVGGALNIDNTELYFATWDQIPSTSFGCSVLQPIKNNYSLPIELFQKMTPGNHTKSGTGFFHSNGPSPQSQVGDVRAMGPIFQGSIDLSKLGIDASSSKKEQKIIVIAATTVDSDWANKPTSKYAPILPPMSHIVNIRTNPDWLFEDSNKIVKGRKVWYSMPLTIVIGEHNNNSTGTQAGHDDRFMDTIELSNRLGETTGGSLDGVSPEISESEDT